MVVAAAGLVIAIRIARAMVLVVVLAVAAMVAMEAKSFKPHGSASEAWTCVQPSTPTTAEKELHAFFAPAQMVACDRQAAFGSWFFG